jgi:tetratricopeptide (TPR) repeat protein
MDRKMIAATAALWASGMTRSTRAEPPAVPDQEQQARSHYERGAIAYNLGDYDEAIAEFKAAYQLSPAPLLLFNLGQAYERKGAGSCGAALRAYRSYLTVGDGSKQKLVERRIHELSSCAAREDEAEKAAATSAASASTAAQPAAGIAAPDAGAEPNGERWLPWTIGSLGLATAATGAGLVLWASHDVGALHCAPWCDTSKLELRANIGYGLLIAGAAGLGVSALWLVLKPAHRGTSHAWLAPGPGQLTVIGTF